ncbi:MAG: hypothetical protein WDM81_04395 [Rhizomicrobium sp.]
MTLLTMPFEVPEAWADGEFQKLDAFAAHQAAELIGDGAAGGVFPETQAGDQQRDEQGLRDGGDDVEGDRRAPGQGFVFDEGVQPLAQHRPEPVPERSPHAGTTR